MERDREREEREERVEKRERKRERQTERCACSNVLVCVLQAEEKQFSSANRYAERPWRVDGLQLVTCTTQPVDLCILTNDMIRHGISYVQ